MRHGQLPRRQTSPAGSTLRSDPAPCISGRRKAISLPELVLGLAGACRLVTRSSAACSLSRRLAISTVPAALGCLGHHSFFPARSKSFCPLARNRQSTSAFIIFSQVQLAFDNNPN